MPSKKDRLYVALYARGGSEKHSYHWALLIGPKTEPPKPMGVRFHAKQVFTATPDGPKEIWILEHGPLPLLSTRRILARFVVAKIQNNDRVEAVLESTPLRGGQPGWNCISWVREALERLHQDGGALGTSEKNWNLIHNTAVRYVANKKDVRRWEEGGKFDPEQVATWSMLENKELMP